MRQRLAHPEKVHDVEFISNLDERRIRNFVNTRTLNELKKMAEQRIIKELQVHAEHPEGLCTWCKQPRSRCMGC